MMLKKLMLPALLATCIGITTSHAYVVDQTQVDGNMKLSYPLVYESNQDVQHKINTDIARYVVAEKAYYESGAAQSVDLTYEVAYEDADYLSIILTPYHYTGGAHGMYNRIGRVYNKHTGDVVPLSYFVRIDSPMELTNGLRNNTLTLESQTGSIETMQNDTWNEVPYISDNYALRGNGNIDLIYQPYEMGPYAYGAMRIRITPEATAALNMK
ncbi:DUF3298 and DUF4163 domain-containing protein [Veillonella agrestimuris]|uniref:DUF3298 and DUF4163 domain-containing protein n=1 Tax=Veillonella agrestimuris TaxID=2941340 RepID=UPI00203AF2E0|nr:DUF3298 and DUF4163 domain-containing protein [Veillonella agrestimuris]